MTAVVAAGFLFALVGAVPASATDDYLVASEPAARQQLKETPGWVTLAFASKANAKLAKVLVLNAAGENVTTGALIVEGTNVTSQLAFDLPKGTYTVMYRTSGADGRVRGGSFQFAYGKGTWSKVEKEVWIGEEEQPPVLANPDPNATSTPSVVPSVTPTATASTPSASPTGTSGPSFSASPGPAGGSDSSGAIGWMVGGGVLLLAAAGAGGWLAWRRRKP
jgi:methionine-rich copper-binding protein CopC